MRNLLYRNIIIISTVLLLSACSTVGGWLNLDTDLKLTFQVDADINPDDRKTPSPLFIRMYELKSTKLFNKANFIDLYERDKEVLGADMINKQRLKRLRPGEDRENAFVLDENTRYVALFAEFLQYRNASYKLILPVSEHNIIANSEVILVSGNTIKLQK